MHTDANVVIIGSGVAGGLIGEILIEKGIGGVVMLDAGPPIRMRDERIWLDTVMAGTVPYTKLYDDPGDFESSGSDPWQIVGGRLFGLGGSAVHWGGWCPRFMPEDFHLYSNTGIGIDWPYGYEDLERYYERAEWYLQVSGNAFPGQRDWRSTPYPLAAAKYPLTTGPLIRALQDLELSFQHLPLSRNTVAINGQPQCQTTGTCGYCPLGARFTGDQPIERLLRRSGFTLATRAAAQEIFTNGKSQVSAVRFLNLDTGVSTTVCANAVFVCAGAIETPKLLLASRSSHWRNGLGNDFDLVGRFLVANPYLYCRATAPSNPMRLQQELNFPTLCSRQWDSPAEQTRGKFLMNMSYGAPLLNPAKMMYAGTTAAGIQSAVTGSTIYEIQGALSPLPSRENHVSLAPGSTRFGLPRTAIVTPSPMVPPETISLNIGRSTEIFSRMGFPISASGAYPQRGDHAASTCRMAVSPDAGVVDTSMRVHGTENVYIASNAILPTIGAANLTLTLVAVIMKAMDVIIAENRLSA